MMRHGLALCLAAILWLHTPPYLSAQYTGVWIPTGNMNIGRTGHQAVALKNGNILVIGGAYDQEYQSSTEIYDAYTGHWTAAPPMATPHYLHSATLLDNGDVLVTGGLGRHAVTAACELYDASTGTWRTTGTMLQARYSHTAVPLPHRQLLVIGGTSGAQTLRTTEVYDASSEEWASAPSMKFPRACHSATVLRNGQVLVTGGDIRIGDSLIVTSSCELFDPATGTWRTTSSMHEARSNHATLLLRDGRVMVIGGSAGRHGELSSCEIYDPQTETWTRVNGMSTTRAGMAAVTLSEGSVLVVGGYNTVHGRTYLALSEIYDPRTGLWRIAPSIATPATTPTLTTLRDGRVLVAGGFSMKDYPQFEYHKTCELFTSPLALSSVEDSPAMTGEIVLLAPQPNPATSETTIRYMTPSSSHVHLALYDELGRQMSTLAEGIQSAGLHHQVVATDDLPNGTYYLHAQIGDIHRVTALIVQH